MTNTQVRERWYYSRSIQCYNKDPECGKEYYQLEGCYRKNDAVRILNELAEDQIRIESPPRVSAGSDDAKNFLWRALVLDNGLKIFLCALNVGQIGMPWPEELELEIWENAKPVVLSDLEKKEKENEKSGVKKVGYARLRKFVECIEEVCTA